MPKLNQMLGIEKGAKALRESTLTKSYQLMEKPALLAGISRTYQPKADDGEKLPSEATKVVVKVRDEMSKAKAVLAKLFDITASKDWSNTVAKADIKVGEKVLLASVPSTYLLFLQKQMTDVATYIKKLPVLDPSENWKFDPAQDCYVTETAQTTRAKKVPRNHVKAEATEKHPAQVEVFYEDILVGTWNTVKFSGALPASEVNEMTSRVLQLQEAIEFALQECNSISAEDKGGATKDLLGFIFSGK